MPEVISLLNGPVAPPRSPTPAVVVGSALVLAAIFLRNARAIAASVIGAAIFLLTYQPLYNESMKGHWRAIIAPAAIDVAYVLATSAVFGPRVILCALPAVAFAAAYLVLLKLKGRSPATIAAGSSILASLYFYFLSLAGDITWRSAFLGALFIVFNLSQVAYVEASLGFRKVWRGAPVLLAALVALPAAVISPYFIITAAEPLEKAVLERKTAFKGDQVKALGHREAVSYAVFLAIVLLLATLSGSAL